MTPSLRLSIVKHCRVSDGGTVLSPCHRPIISILALTYLRLDLRKAALKRSDEMTEMSALICGGVGDRTKDRTEERK